MLSSSNGRDAIRAIVAELAPRQVEDLRDELRLVDDLEYSSLALTELAFTLEDEFDLQPIDEPTARAISTVGDICDHVEGELRTRSEAAANVGPALPGNA
ncbi:acyl carrier protein [Kribbella sp. NPDC050820]|uniref:acyl carrier protein n=1 Tax=Kribbella sp. NPDC050820 TaxID=3155408 RepID=UPI0033C213DE